MSSFKSGSIGSPACTQALFQSIIDYSFGNSQRSLEGLTVLTRLYQQRTLETYGADRELLLLESEGSFRRTIVAAIFTQKFPRSSADGDFGGANYSLPSHSSSPADRRNSTTGLAPEKWRVPLM
ncbi:MAG: hypothetical protein EOP06_02500 [Proteobacteria bacterium]|nr:MAG: hypothetical protein EOP06_02500 [Pseudomonadota bacterium]